MEKDNSPHSENQPAQSAHLDNEQFLQMLNMGGFPPPTAFHHGAGGSHAPFTPYGMPYQTGAASPPFATAGGSSSTPPRSPFPNPYFPQGSPVTSPPPAYPYGYGFGSTQSTGDSHQSPTINLDSPSPDLSNHTADTAAFPPPVPTSRRKKRLVTRRPGSTLDHPPERTKQSNYVPFEDRLVVSSWLEVSCDPIANTGQKKETFWGRIVSLYNSKRGEYPERTAKSLQSRWDSIKSDTSKFAAYYYKVLACNPSGYSDADKTAAAASDFAEFEGRPFAFMHCWDLMKDNPKWQDTRQYKGHPPDFVEGFGDKSPDIPDNVVDGEESCPTSGSKRPMGREAARTARKKGSSTSTADGSEFTGSMLGLVVSKLTTNVDVRTLHHQEWMRIKTEQREEDRKRNDETLELMRKQTELGQQKLAAKMLEQERNDEMLELTRKQTELGQQKLATKMLEQERSNEMLQLMRRQTELTEQKAASKETLAKLEKEKIALMRSQEEDRILSKDLSTLPENVRKWYEKRQREILENL